MKKSKLAITAVSAIVLMASCNSDDTPSVRTVSDVPISYSTGGSRFAGNQFENGDDFAVWANYCTDEAKVPYFECQTVGMAEDVWSSSQTIYWPTSNKLDFYAVYPSPETRPDAPETNQIDFQLAPVPTLTYKINNFTEKTDLMVAKTPAVDCPSSEAVPLHFKHVLSRLKFRLTNSCKYGAIPLDVHVDSIVIYGRMHDTGTLDWSTMSLIPVPGSERVFSRKSTDFEIDASTTRDDVSGVFFIPEEVGDLGVRVVWWTLLNTGSGKAKAEKYEVEKRLTTEVTLKAGSVSTITLTLTCKDDGKTSGDINLN